MGNYPSILVHMANDYLVSNADARVVPRYGWRPDVPDRRDLVLAHYPTDDDASPTQRPGDPADVLRVDLRKQCPAVYDDKGLACSTVSALATLLEFHELRTRPNAGYEPSRLCWYYLTREMQGTQRADAGASFRDALKVVNDEGVCDEVDWPFDATCVTVAPEWATYESTPRSRPIRYRRVPQTLEALKYCLTHEWPVACGLSVYTSFESSVTRRTGQVTLPACAQDLADVPPKDDGHGNASTAPEADDDDAHLGGHAVVLVGYDDTEQQFIVRNSQGASWGANGYGFVPYSYLLNPLLARDFWVLDGDASDKAEAHATARDEEDTRGDQAKAHATASEEEDMRGDKGDQVGDHANTDDDTVPPLFQALLDRVGV